MTGGTSFWGLTAQARRLPLALASQQKIETELLQKEVGVLTAHLGSAHKAWSHAG